MTFGYPKSVVLKQKGSGAAERLNFGNKFQIQCNEVKTRN